jgi:hypothetical protein
VKFKGRKTAAEVPHLAEIRELLEDVTEVSSADMVRFVVCAASDHLVQEINSTEDLQIVVLMIIMLRSVSLTGSPDNEVGDTSGDIAAWATTLRVCFATEELRRRNLARGIVYPKNLFSLDEEESKSAAQYNVAEEIPQDLSDGARRILMAARRRELN